VSVYRESSREREHCAECRELTDGDRCVRCDRPYCASHAPTRTDRRCRICESQWLEIVRTAEPSAAISNMDAPGWGDPPRLDPSMTMKLLKLFGAVYLVTAIFILAGSSAPWLALGPAVALGAGATAVIRRGRASLRRRFLAQRHILALPAPASEAMGAEGGSLSDPPG
jgi:hypothetical protein